MISEEVLVNLPKGTFISIRGTDGGYASSFLNSSDIPVSQVFTQDAFARQREEDIKRINQYFIRNLEQQKQQTKSRVP